MSDADKKNITLLVRQRERILFNGEIKSFSSINETGVFDVLYEHANFVSIINKKYTVHKLDGTSIDTVIGEGIVRVHDNKVTVYLGIIG